MAIPGAKMPKAIQYGPYYHTTQRALQPQRQALGLETMTESEAGAERYGDIKAQQEHMRISKEQQRIEDLQQQGLNIEQEALKLEQEKWKFTKNAGPGKGGK